MSTQTVSRDTKVPGRLLAWAALLVALGASVLANVAFARAELGPRLSAGTAPVLVVLAAGLLERVPLARARWWQRWLAGAGLVFVVLAAFVTSYQHQHALLLAYGNPELSAVLLPFAVDALIVMASICLAVIAERRREMAGMPAGVALVAADLDPGRLLAPVATEMVTTEGPDQIGPSAVPLTAHVPPVLLADVHRDLSSGQGESANRAAPAATRPRPPARRQAANERGSRSGGSSRRPAQEMRAQIADLRAQQPDISQAALARLLGVSPTRIRQIERPVNGTEARAAG